MMVMLHQRRSSVFAVVLALGLGCVPVSASAQPVGPGPVDCDSFDEGQQVAPIVVVTEPQPGTTLAAGTLTLRGAAFDCHADTGSGISRVSVFLGKPDAGGVALGDAVLRDPSPIRVLPADQYGHSGWSLSAPVPLKAGQENVLYVYAHSALTNMDSSVAVPIGVASTSEGAPAPTAVPAPAPGTGEGGGPVVSPAPSPPPDIAPAPDDDPSMPPADEPAAE